MNGTHCVETGNKLWKITYMNSYTTTISFNEQLWKIQDEYLLQITSNYVCNKPLKLFIRLYYVKIYG